MAWHIVQKYLEQSAEHATLVGKYWVTFFFVLRFLLVVSIADSVFGDEQGAFVCNTLTPGCNQICYNDFSPISLIRLWAFQILGVALPSIIFIAYTAHKMVKIDQAKKLRKKEQEKKQQLKDQAKKLKEEARKRAAEDRKRRALEEGLPEYTEFEDAGNISDKKPEKGDKKKKGDDEDGKVVAVQLSNDTPSRLMLAYVSQVLFRLAVEIIFNVVQFSIYVFKFWVPELFKCARYPCDNAVDCFVSRPKEKTIMVWVMFATSLIMIFLNVIELHHLGLRNIWEAWKTRGQDITKEYRLGDNVPTFKNYGGGVYGSRYPRGFPQAVGIRVAYARSQLSGDDGSDYDGEMA